MGAKNINGGQVLAKWIIRILLSLTTENRLRTLIAKELVSVTKHRGGV